MIFNVSAPNLINMILIAAGIGICVLNLIQVSISSHLRKEVRNYFRIFFIMLLTYISAHLARQIMEGIPGGSIHTGLQTVTFIEMLSAGFMAYLMAILVYYAARREKRSKTLEILLLCILIVHVAIMTADMFGHFIYSFDGSNIYHREALYLLSNICPLIMLVINCTMLIRYRNNIKRRIRSAFWVYMIAPILAIGIQSVLYSIQLIIFASVGAAVYMFFVIIGEQNEEYQNQREESSRLETELSMATRIQAAMLPNIFPAFPERNEFDIYASMDPAKEVGGDFYDYFLIDDDHLGIVMADVAGKGVPAALFMMASKIIIQNNAILKKEPKAALEAANYQICQNNQADMFVTVWLGILDLKTGILSAANAGHEYPVLKMPGKDFTVFKDEHSFVVGGMDAVKYREYDIQLEKDSVLFLYTDGVAEATNADNELFGEDRMLKAMNREPDASPEKVMENVIDSINDFVAGAEQFDDITMLCLRYNGTQKE